MIRYSAVFSFLMVLFFNCASGQTETSAKFQTVCNPVDISYRFRLESPSCREAADPTVILFKNEYYLFASKSGGYWSSDDLTNWNFIPTRDFPTEDYAPTVVAIQDTLYFLASTNKIFKSVDLKAGKWKLAATLPFGVVDPALFLDDDQRLYFYWGCSDKAPLYGIELDYKNNFTPVGNRIELIRANTAEHGWEVPGDYNTLYKNAPWIEGAWMNKFGGKYYLQYAGPGTQFKSYSDGVYTSEKPMGPFTLSENNPFAYKPEGFVAGAGHGSTFADRYGNYWHIGTVTISQKHMFERRLALFPTFFDADGLLHADTRFGDYPMIIPNKKIKSANDIFPGWMLLSYRKPVSVSSSAEGFPAENMTDENMRTYWAAQSATNKEWACVDLGAACDVYAVQVNFAEHNTTVLGKTNGLFYQFVVEKSTDNKNWKTIIDRSGNQTDNSHQYIQLGKKETCRYLRIRNLTYPDGSFALSDLRVFGKGNGDKPEPVAQLTVDRKPENRRTVRLTWPKSAKAIGYNIRFGIAPDKLYQTYTVYSDTKIDINSLNTNQKYYFSIEAFNENGISASRILENAE
jgi:xylan 1,4-beta-xylosidase